MKTARDKNLGWCFRVTIALCNSLCRNGYARHIHCSLPVMVWLIALFTGSSVFAAAPLKIAPFNTANFMTSEARLAWLPQSGSADVYAADSGAWGTDHVMVIPCNVSSQMEQRCYYDHLFPSPMDFTQYKEIALEIYIPDADAVNLVTLYFESGSGWYDLTRATKKGWQTLIFNFAETVPSGAVAGWNSIQRIRVSPWAGSSPNAVDLAVRTLQVTPKSLVTIVKDATGDPTRSLAIYSRALISPMMSSQPRTCKMVI